MDKAEHSVQQRKLRHRGRLAQIPIYLGKLLRSFVYMSDWKLLPMSAIIAALVSIVVRKDFFVTMEGTLKGAFALTCVSIWNGCFNSIQSICRERNIIKREHRSGMHITSYVASHMLYQALLCLAQTALTLYVCRWMGVKFPSKGFMTPFLILDIGITIFLISYASDMLALLISAVSRTTTAAMTVMPFILIFQLVFSGGIFSLPAWSNGISNFTLSNYGLKCIAAQADYNNLPMVTAWNTLSKVKNDEIICDVTLQQILDAINERDNPTMKAVRDTVLADGLTFGDLAALLAESDELKAQRDQIVHMAFTAGQLMDLIGEDSVKTTVLEKTAAAGYNAAYERTEENIWFCWRRITLLGAACAVLAVIALEFIDKDKR